MEKPDGMELERLLHRRKPELPVFLLSDPEGACGVPAGRRMTVYLKRPISSGELQGLLKRSGERRV